MSGGCQARPAARDRAQIRLLLSVSCVLLAFSVCRPSAAGPPFVTDDPEPAEFQHWEVNYALTGTGLRGGGSAALPLIDANYGALPDLQLHVQPQLALAKSTEGTRFGVGDTEIGVKYRFIEEDDQGWVPMVSLYPLFEVPTGDRRRGLGAGVGQTFIPVWAQKTIGKWTIYGGSGYWIDSGAAGKNAWFGGAVALYQVTEALQLGGEAFYQTARVSGGRDTPGFNFGGTYAITEGYSLLFSAGRGLADPETTNRVSAYLALQAIY